MSALDLLRRLYVSGADVGINAEGGVRVTRNQPPPELLAELKEGRDGIVTALQEHHVGASDDVFQGMTRRYVVPVDCLAPNACACLGPCSRFLMKQPCKREHRPGR